MESVVVICLSSTQRTEILRSSHASSYAAQRTTERPRRTVVRASGPVRKNDSILHHRPVNSICHSPPLTDGPRSPPQSRFRTSVNIPQKGALDAPAVPRLEYGPRWCALPSSLVFPAYRRVRHGHAARVSDHHRVPDVANPPSELDTTSSPFPLRDDSGFEGFAVGGGSSEKADIGQTYDEHVLIEPPSGWAHSPVSLENGLSLPDHHAPYLSWGVSSSVLVRASEPDRHG